MKSSLKPEVLEKLVGHAIKITSGKTANGKNKDGPMICKLLSVDGSKAVVLPKGHRRPETVSSDRICIWQKGLRLSNMDDEDIKMLMGEKIPVIPSLQKIIADKKKPEFDISPKPKIDPPNPTQKEQPVAKPKVEVKKSKRLVADIGIFVIRHKNGKFYKKIIGGYVWVKSIDDASTYKNPIIISRVIGRAVKKDPDFSNCEAFDIDDVGKFEEPKTQAMHKPKTTKIAPKKSSDKTQILDQMQELFFKRDQINAKKQLLLEQLAAKEKELTDIEKDIDATVELMNEIR